MQLTDQDVIYLRHNLDLLFVALNPPAQSNANGHYFSGRQSLFFPQLFESGLIVKNLDRSDADITVFGDNKYNYKNRNYGVIDLLPQIEETNSNKVKVQMSDVNLLAKRIKEYKPKNVCIIHGEVMKSFKKWTGTELKIGDNGKVFPDQDTTFYCNYFPNGNPIEKEIKIEIYKIIRGRL